MNINQLIEQTMGLITDFCRPNEMTNLTNVEGIVSNAAAYFKESGVGDGTGVYNNDDVLKCFAECKEQLGLTVHPSYRPVNLVDVAESILFPATGAVNG